MVFGQNRKVNGDIREIQALWKSGFRKASEVECSGGVSI